MVQSVIGGADTHADTDVGSDEKGVGGQNRFTIAFQKG
jgi:hypothetical protein